METHEIDQLYAEVELSLPHEGGEIRLRPGQASAELEGWLGERGVESLVFLPLQPLGEDLPPKKARRRREKLERAIGDDEALPGELLSEARGDPTAGLFLPGLKRGRAREIAAAAGLPRFYWCRVGTPLEMHRTALPDGESIFEGDESFSSATRHGLLDLAHTLGDLVGDPRPLLTLAGGRARGLAAIFLTLVVLGFAAHAVSSTAPRPAAEEVTGADVEDVRGDSDGAPAPGVGDREADDDAWAPRLLRTLLHPVFLPAILIGLCLRSRRRRSRGGGRELTAAETEAAWRGAAPEVLGAWLLAALGVGLLELARSSAQGGLDVVDLVEDVGRGIVICLWILPALGYARNGEDVVGKAFTALVGALIAIFGLKLSLAFAGFGTRILWAVLGSILPFALPEMLVEIGDAVAAVAFQVIFLGLMLGFTWTRERELYGMWASDELPSE